MSNPADRPPQPVDRNLSRQLGQRLGQELGQALKKDDLDIVDIVPIPTRGDKMVRMRTIEEVLEEFDALRASGEANDGGEEVVGYLIQVKPRRAQAASAAGARAEASPEPGREAFSQDRASQDASQPGSPLPGRPTLDEVYLPSGKLNVPYLLANAEMLFDAGEHQLSRKIYKAVLQSGERSAAALHGIGRCLQAEGRLEAARLSFEESIAYQPTLETYRGLAMLLMELEKHEQAAETLDRALKHVAKLGESELGAEEARATRFELHQAAGNCWARARRVETAQACYLKALELNSAADSIRTNLGALFLENGRIAEAKRHFEDAVASNPRSAKAHSGLGSCYLAEGQKRHAHDCFAKSLSCDLHNPTALFHLVKCAYEIRSYATAARLVEEYVEAAPVNANLLYSLAGLQYHLGRHGDARATAERIMGFQPGHTGARELINTLARHPNNESLQGSG